MAILIKDLLFALLIPGTVAVYVPLFLARGQDWAGPVWGLIAIAMFIVGTGIVAWCVWDFAAFGRGTPAPIDPPKHLVVRGLYRFTRNPMYVGILAILLGWTVLFFSRPLAVYTACVGAGFHAFVVFYEEPHLLQMFGEAYAEYRQQVPRWWPRKPSGR